MAEDMEMEWDATQADAPMDQASMIEASLDFQNSTSAVLNQAQVRHLLRIERQSCHKETARHDGLSCGWSDNPQQYPLPNNVHSEPASANSSGRLRTQHELWSESVRGMTPPPGQPGSSRTAMTSGSFHTNPPISFNAVPNWPASAYALLAEEKAADERSMKIHILEGLERHPMAPESRKRAIEFKDADDERWSANSPSRQIAKIKRGRSKYDSPVTAIPAVSLEPHPVVDTYSLFWSDDKPRGRSFDFEGGVNGERLFQPLEFEDSIRVLCIEPGEDALCVQMYHTRLSDTDYAYEALSYAWGESEFRDKMGIENDSIVVTSTLHDALLHLRLKDEPRYIWNDSACINKWNLHERSHQVALMDKIYARASSVIMWLGPDPSNKARLALAVLCSIANAAAADGTSIEQANFYSNGISSANVPDVPCREGPPKATFKALWNTVQEFFDHNLFRRVWCIKEIAVAHTVNIYWGTCRISWVTVGLAATRLKDGQPRIARVGTMEGLFNVYLMFRSSAVQIAPNGTCEAPLRLPLAKLLSLTSHFNSTDPKDRVYSLLGMPTTDYKGESQVSISVDYNLPEPQVYISMVEYLLSKDVGNGDNQNLAMVLAAVSHATSDSAEQALSSYPSWPSWVPRWDETYRQLLMPGVSPSLMQKSSEVFISCTPQPRLHVKAIFCGAIRSTSESINDLLTHEGVESQSHPSYLAMTLTGGKSWSGVAANVEEHCSDYRDYLHYCRSGAKHGMDAGAQRFMLATQLIARGRSWFDMLAGPHIGLGPGVAWAGDQIVILEGCGTPFVLRRCDSKNQEGRHDFLLIGECYLHDILQIVQDSGAVKEDITLI